MATKKKVKKFNSKYIYNFIGMAIGAFLAAIAIQVFLYPNKLIDGGIIGISLISARLLGNSYLPYFLLIFNIPFIYLAYKFIRKTFVANMLIAVLLFAAFLLLLHDIAPFHAETFEIIVIGGAVLGTGIGLIIRNGGCTDGTEILAIIINRKLGFTVGQIVLFINIFIFTAYGWIFMDWHIALQSLMMYIVAFKMMDIVIAGLDEVKSVLILTAKPKKVSNLIMHEMGLGLTVIPGIGGFSGEHRDILFIIVERLDLSELKTIVLREDPTAFMAIENLHEVAYGRQISKIPQKKKKIRKHPLLKSMQK
jgi:uncharacterized membrane-anchored protein YitT (DUF2179 family)